MKIYNSDLEISNSNSIFSDNEFPFFWQGLKFYDFLDSIPMHLYYDSELFFNDYAIRSTILAKNIEDNRILHLLDIMKYPFPSTINFDESKLTTLHLSLGSPFNSPTSLNIHYFIPIGRSEYDFLGNYKNLAYTLEFFQEVNGLDISYFFKDFAEDYPKYILFQEFYRYPGSLNQDFAFFTEPFYLNLKVDDSNSKMIGGYISDSSKNVILRSQGSLGILKITLPNGAIDKIVDSDYVLLKGPFFRINCFDESYSYPRSLKGGRYCLSGKYKVHWEFGDTDGDGIGDVFADKRILSFDATYTYDGNKFEIVKFLRGDADGNGKVELTDAVFILNFIFQNGGAPSCLKAADANDDGFIDISDPIKILFFLFLDPNNKIAEPYPSAGLDTTGDGLGCNA